MHPDVAKLVEAGRIQKALGERLSQLAPGNFCLHRSFGAGKITDWDLPQKRVTVDFERSAQQQMDLQFAINKTDWIPMDDFRARKIEQIEELRTLATKDSVALVIHLLESHGGTMTGDALEKEISGTVVPEANFKKWWDGAKKALRESRRVIVPSKRTEALQLRGADESASDSMLSDFRDSRDVKGMIKALESIAGDIGAFDESQSELREILAEIDDASRKAARMNLGQALQLIAARDEVISSADSLTLPPESLLLSDLVMAADMDRLTEDLNGLPTARQRAVYEAFPIAFGDEWVPRMVQVFDRVGARGVTEIARLLIDRDELGQLLAHLKTALARRALDADALIWVCRERKGPSAEVFGADVGASILNLLETDHLSDGPRKTSRLQSLLGDDKALLIDIVGTMDVNEARNFARRLLDCPVFGELEKKSLMARIIKARPETNELVSGERGSKQRDEALLVSWESLERKKQELDDLTRNRIPQNTKEISIARSYGDLRENFEYKSAKDLQKILMHRKAELERDIGRARGTDLLGADASQVNVGTIVTLTEDSGEEVVMTVLGAWDSDPDKQIVSYLSETGNSLMDSVPGDAIQIRDAETGTMRTLTVKSIIPWTG